ncbi:MAG: ArsA family ATPase [Actinomycetota bacterium]|nr:ArsA family ATPase [Acidimicrobiia bacterium]MDQ3148063.1 ArsA family ATPase [Actinomycetota bacterium]
MPGLLDRRLLFVTGKGGVGKTTVAAALGLLASRSGKRTLVCEIDAKGDLADFFECGPTSFEPREVSAGLFAMTMETEASLKEYLRLQVRLPLISRIGPLARAFDFLANAAPGVKEILTVGKPVWETRQRNYDLVVVDAPATGHIVGLLRAPSAINELVSVGLIREQTGWMIELLADPATTGVVIASSPEEMPVVESLELIERLKDTDVDVAAIVVNRVLPELFGRAEEEVFEELRTPALTEALGEAAGGPVGDVLEAARLAVTLRRTRAGHLTRLREEVDPALPVLYVPELFNRSSGGLRTVAQVADALGAELEG